MGAHRKYLVTTDPETGETIKVEEIGEAGDLSEVSADSVFSTSTAGAGGPPQYIVNIFIGTGPGGQGAPTVTTQSFGQRRAVGPKSAPEGPVAKGPKSPHQPDDGDDETNGEKKQG